MTMMDISTNEEIAEQHRIDKKTYDILRRLEFCGCYEGEALYTLLIGIVLRISQDNEHYQQLRDELHPTIYQLIAETLDRADIVTHGCSFASIMLTEVGEYLAKQAKKYGPNVLAKMFMNMEDENHGCYVFDKDNPDATIPEEKLIKESGFANLDDIARDIYNMVDEDSELYHKVELLEQAKRDLAKHINNVETGKSTS